MTARVKLSKDELREALPDVAAFVDALRESFGPGVRVLGIRTDEWMMGRPDVVPGIRLSACVWDLPSKPVVEDNNAERAARRRRRG